MVASPLPHTRFCEQSGRISLEVDDAELANWLDDELTEKLGVRVDGFQFVGSRTQLWFPAEQDVAALVAALSQLDPREAERIFLINDKPSSLKQVLDDFSALPLHDASVSTLEFDWNSATFRIRLSVFFQRTRDAKPSELVFSEVTGVEIPRDESWGRSTYVNRASFEPPNLYLLEMQSGDVMRIRAGGFQLRKHVDERRPTSR